MIQVVDSEATRLLVQELPVHIVVLMGGNSPEREISLASGQAVAAALESRGHQVTLIDLDSVHDVMNLPQLQTADVVFPALHGGQGEDGHLQALLEVLEVPYALSGPLPSALAMNKGAAKRLMRGAGIPTPDWFLVAWDRVTGQPRNVSSTDEREQIQPAPNDTLTVDHIRSRVITELGFPVVIKPNAAGSSVGVVIVKEATAFATAFTKVASRSQDVLLEKYVPGRELTAAIFLGRRLPLLEIRPRQGFYDYENKYTPGASEYQVPAAVHSPVYEQISDDALRTYDLLECSGVVRIDFRLDGDDYYCLEVNTIPGMTDTSLVPKAAAAVGIEFAAMLEDLCRDALQRFQADAPSRS